MLVGHEAQKPAGRFDHSGNEFYLLSLDDKFSGFSLLGWLFVLVYLSGLCYIFHSFSKGLPGFDWFLADSIKQPGPFFVYTSSHNSQKISWNPFPLDDEKHLVNADHHRP
jgi:hypothetical protein